MVEVEESRERECLERALRGVSCVATLSGVDNGLVELVETGALM